VRWVSRLVSFVVIALVAFAFVLFIRAKMPATSVGESFLTCAAFRDGSKLATGSPVMIAGVRVGEVSRLTIDGDFARIEMRLRDDTTLPPDSWVTKRAYSPFGDSYVEIVPTGPDEGAQTSERLRSGQCLMRVAEGASTDRMLRVVARTMPQLDLGLERLQEVGAYGRKWAAGALEHSILDTNKWLDGDPIGSPLGSVDQAMGRLERATTNAAAAVSDATPGISDTFTRLERGVSDARKRMSEVTVDMRDGLRNARDGLGSVDHTIDDFNEILIAVNEGRGQDSKGTLGRLINDPKLYEDIEDATDSVRDGVGTFTRFKSWLGLRTEFNVFSRQPRFYVTAEVRARTDKFYLVELEKGQLGDFPADTLDTNGSSTFTRTQEIRDRLRFTVQFGKTFGNWFQIRGGLKESTFGFGADVLAGNGRLRLSADIYGGYTRTDPDTKIFGRPLDISVPRVKLAGALAVFRSIYILAGVDDVLTKPNYLRIRNDNSQVPIQFDEIRYGRDYFFGASLHFDEADLAVLLRMYGALLVAML
jgi:phospholipid/cholesterol/gamma-HCH transport system substrate-binding protein